MGSIEKTFGDTADTRDDFSSELAQAQPPQRAFDPEATAFETKSSAFFGEHVPRPDLEAALFAFIEAAQRLDKIKKALFYGRSYETQLRNVGNDDIPNCVHLPQTVYPGNETFGRDVIHAIIGKATEDGELCELLFASMRNHQPLDRVGFIEEIGDSRWYDRIGLPAYGMTGSVADQQNYAKLSAKMAAKLGTHARYKDGFTAAEAINRDTTAERAALEKTQANA
jgi:hypothetical protein